MVNPTVVAERKMAGKSGSTFVLAKQPVHLGAVVLSAYAAPLTAYLQRSSTAAVAVTAASGDVLAAAVAVTADVGDVLAAAGDEWHSAAAIGLAVAEPQNFAVIAGPAAVVVVGGTAVDVEPLRGGPFLSQPVS